jgi:hypothetical protein
MDIYKELHKFNGITYTDSSHEYVVGKKKCISGTKFIKLFTPEFDSDGQAEKYALKHKLEKQDVLDLWADKRDASTIKGTHVHSYAEHRYMNKRYEPSFENALSRFFEYANEKVIDPYEKCIEHFNKFHEASKGSLIPIRSEVVVWDEKLMIAGMLDQIFWNEKMQEYQIWDWKTNKKINTFSIYKQRMLDPISNLHDCELNKYALQLSLYKYIIEKNTNIKLGNSYLVHLTEHNSSYEVIPVRYLKREIEAMIQHYNQAA